MGNLFTLIGQLVLLFVEMVRCLFVCRLEPRAWLVQCYQIGVRSLAIANITAVFTGMVLALQAAFALQAFGADLFVADLVSLSIVRELGPVLTALLVGGRVGAGITAELGSMRITQQLDAMRAMATSPVHKLVIPRVLACLVCIPALTVIACMMGVMGGLLLSATELNIDGHFYLSRVLTAVEVGDMISGFGKSVFFGFFIGIISCNNGMRVSGGADGVGLATTKTVVAASITILVSDFFLTKMFHIAFGF